MANLPIVDTEEYTIDLSTVPDPEPLPKGMEFLASVSDPEIYVSENSGKVVFKATYTINPSQFPPDFDADNAPEDGVKLMSYASVDCGSPPQQPTRLGLSRYRKLYENHGLEAPKNFRLVPMDYLAGAWGLPEEDLADFATPIVKVLIDHDKGDDGVIRARIKRVSPNI